MDSNFSPNFLKCGLVNIQSIRNKTVQVRDLITDKSYDIFCVCETWLQELDNACIREMTPSTHSFLHVARQGRIGGGVGIFVHSSFSQVKVVNHYRATSFEYIEVDFKHNNCSYSFIVVYRPPNLNARIFFEEFEEFLESINLMAKKVVICGDFNFWLDVTTDRNTMKFNELIDSHQLMNNVAESTSSTGHILDLVLCESANNFVSNLVVDERCYSTSIHKLISFRIPGKKDKVKKKITLRNKSNFIPSEFIDFIKSKFEELLSAQCDHTGDFTNKSDCADCLMEIYNNIISSEYNNRCPETEKIITVVDRSPWFNSETLHAKREKRRKENAWIRKKTEDAWLTYCAARNRYNILLRQTKIKYYRKKIDEAANDMTKLYFILNGLTGCTSRKTLPEGKLDQELANDFLYFFVRKIEMIIQSFSGIQVPPIIASFHANSKLSQFQLVDSNTISRIITKIKKTNCALDPMPISEITSAENLSALINVLVKIINTSISKCKFPTTEKIAVVKPILKGTLDPENLSSYRPVSNLSFVSKIIENVILEQLNVHLEKVGALPDNQSAYRQFYSTETTICSVVSDLLFMMDEGKCGILVLLDLSAAFDTVVHNLLIEDLKMIGIDGDALEYLSDYLRDRKYYVKIGNAFSDFAPLTRGVPQGSVLGPILFCIYTMGLSTLLQNLGVEFRIFADDTQFYLAVSNIDATSERVSLVLENIKNWMNYKQLKLNISKTEYMITGKKNNLKRISNVQFIVENNPVQLVDKVKDLGVILDSTLSLDSQINNVIRTSNYHLRNIAFIRKYLDEDSVKKLVYNFVISRIDYCNSIYYSLPNFRLRKLQMILNRAARLVCGIGRRDRITPVLIELHWLPIKARIKYKICVLTHQAIVTGKPVYLRNLLNMVLPREGINTRSNYDGRKLLEPRCSSNVGFRAFKSAAPRLYNTLPKVIRTIDDIALFKKKLKTFLFGDCYDLNDYCIREEYTT